MSTKCDKTYNGTIKRTKGKHLLRRAIFQYGESDTFYYLRLFGLKLKKRKKKENCLLEINENTKCLMVCPHPDDEMLGAGAVMLKYSNNFDCLCMGSSGVATPEIGAKERAYVRIKEFNEIMDTIGVKNHWIFLTYGVPRFDRQMDLHFEEYCNALTSLKDYDYIFLPHPRDGHHEHRYITNKLFKRIAKKIGFSDKTKIVFYEVWEDMNHPNVFIDASGMGKIYAKDGSGKKYQKPYSKLLGTTDESLLELKYRITNMYESQFTRCDIFVIQTLRKKAINNGANPIGRFEIVDIKKYLR
jgi:LmbE family N-acetylglucosaminyl deacetylase